MYFFVHWSFFVLQITLSTLYLDFLELESFKMSNDFDLTIELPTRTFMNRNVQGVILPAVRADVEILPDRAPSVFVLDYGLLQILTAKGEVLDKYFIYSGVADVAQNKCKIMTQDIVPYSDISISSAKEKVVAARDENERLFYTMIVNYLVGTRKRYLRTLNVFSRKKGKMTFKKPKETTVPPEQAGE